MANTTLDEFINHLREQMGLLEASATAFDAGTTYEGTRLATTMRILLHDTPRQMSLLTHLGVKLDLRYLSTGSVADLPISPDLPDGGILEASILAPIRIGSATAPDGHFAPLDTGHVQDWLPFYEWWTAEVISTHLGGFTRKDVVLSLADKDGGAHIDAKLPGKYANLRRFGHGWSITKGNGEIVPPGSPVLATARQIAYETDTSIRRQLAHLLT